MEFFGAFSPLNHNLLHLANPLNVLYESLLNLIVTHCAVEGLLSFMPLYSQVANLIQDFFYSHLDIDHVLLLKLFGLVENRLFFLQLSNFIF